MPMIGKSRFLLNPTTNSSIRGTCSKPHRFSRRHEHCSYCDTAPNPIVRLVTSWRMRMRKRWVTSHHLRVIEGSVTGLPHCYLLQPPGTYPSLFNLTLVWVRWHSCYVVSRSISSSNAWYIGTYVNPTKPTQYKHRSQPFAARKFKKSNNLYPPKFQITSRTQPTNPSTTFTTIPQKLNSFIPNAPLKLPLLVLPNSLLASIPVCPFEVANTAGSTVAVPIVLVNTVVGKVREADPECSVNAEEEDERKTRAAQGAGTGMVHVPGGEQEMVWMLSVPCKRPSEAKLSPNVWRKTLIGKEWNERTKKIFDHLTSPRKIAFLRHRSCLQIFDLYLTQPSGSTNAVQIQLDIQITCATGISDVVEQQHSR